MATKAKELARSLKAGKLYCRSELAGASAAVDRHLGELVRGGVL